MSIVRRIKREARKSPAKAAILVGLLGYALYAWAPLMVAFLTVDEDSPHATAPGEAESGQLDQPPLNTLAAADNTNTIDRPTWQEFRQWRQDSPWMAPAELSQTRDPFQIIPDENAPSAARDETEEAPTTTPEQAIAGIGIQLTGTIVSPQRRVAILDGRAYRQGDTISVEHLGTTWELEIRRIEPNRVTLGWHSIERELTPPERPKVGRIELVDRSRQ